jgi:hypothetical protein
MKKLNYAVLVALTSASFYSSAVLQTINVTATIDTSLSMTAVNGQPISDLEMKYSADGKLNAAKTKVKINTNAEKDINVKLEEEPELAMIDPVTGASTNTIPLTVTLGEQALTTSDTKYSMSKWFNTTSSPSGASPAYDIANGSKPMNLVISATNQLATYVSGQYTGAINLVIEQATTSS